MTQPDSKLRAPLSLTGQKTWRSLQTVFWILGFCLWLALWLKPQIGLLLFWNLLIPVAPALFVVATGFWRNVCPLATTALLPRKLGLSRKIIPTPDQAASFRLASVILLLVLVPLRHPLFNRDGTATALLLTGASALAIACGFLFDWKSAWCSGLCPVHGVEKLYGSQVQWALPNAHCTACARCVVPCPDSTPHIRPNITVQTVQDRISGLLLVGGLPGFIYGWFQVADQPDGTGMREIITSYFLPVLCMGISLCAYGLLKYWILTPKRHARLDGFFAATSVSCYYFYRLPALFGFGKNVGDGLLVDLKTMIPYWVILLAAWILGCFFYSRLWLSDPVSRRWTLRPPFSGRTRSLQGAGQRH